MEQLALAAFVGPSKNHLNNYYIILKLKNLGIFYFIYII